MLFLTIGIRSSGTCDLKSYVQKSLRILFPIILQVANSLVLCDLYVTKTRYQLHLLTRVQ